MGNLIKTIEENWTSLLAELENLCDELGRPAPTVVAVTKTRSLEEVQAAIDIGVTDFGENYAQEFERKAKRFPDMKWHYIGHLQRGNADLVTPHADIIHTLDRKKLTNRLLHFDYKGDNFIQVNISGESSKSGIEYSTEKVNDLLTYSRDQGLNVSGLMTIGHLDWDDEKTLQEFKDFVGFGRDLGLPEFSLGMTSDWKLAVEAGSTYLRVGSAIFGPRD